MRTQVLALLFCGWVAGCHDDAGGPADDLAPTAPEAPAPAIPKAEASLAAHMRDHFTMVTQARDAVIRGSVEEAQGPLIWLAQHTYDREVPEAWTGYIHAMQEAAREAGDAASPETLGVLVARIAGECGRCHAALEDGPDFGPVGEPPAGPDSTRADMLRHAWAAAGMWEGLVAPDPGRFAAAAVALVAAPPPAGTDEAQAAGRAGLQAVIAQARAAHTPIAQERLYGLYLGRCAACHGAQGVRPILKRP